MNIDNNRFKYLVLHQQAKLAFLFVFSFFCFSAFSQNAFVTTWKTDNPGFTNATSIQIPTAPGLNYKYDVDWDNDGVFDELGLQGSVIHDFLVAGTYKIGIRGMFPQIYINNQADRQKIINIDQWGDIEWKSFQFAFKGASNLYCDAEDAPDLSKVISLQGAFDKATVFDGDLSQWDVSHVTDLRYLFHKASAFNSDISNWNVSQVTLMNFTFGYAKSFIGDISQWDVSHVTDMAYLFHGAESFNSVLKDWQVGQVTDMRSLFFNNPLFDQDISNWDVSQVTYMKSMFFGAKSFNQDISQWNVGKVENMVYMFSEAFKFNSDISQWNVGAVHDMSFMFNEAFAFNKDLNNWDVSQVTKMRNMFFKAYAFNGNIEAWKVNLVTDMSNMFYNTQSFNHTLGNWNIANVFNMYNMLYGSKLSVSNYDNTLIGWASQMVKDSIDLGIINLKYCEGESARFLLKNTYGWVFSGDQKDCTSSTSFITTWNTANSGVSNDSSIIIPISPGEIYNYKVDWDDDGIFDETNIAGNANHQFAKPGVYTIRIEGVFPRIYFNNEADSKKIVSINQWGANKWSSMEGAFAGCEHLTVNTNGTPDLTQVKDMSRMFFGAIAFNNNINSWNVGGVENMSELFRGASSFNQALISWNTSQVKIMSRMFFGASAFDKNINGWAVGNVTDMSDMFRDANIFNQPLDSWDVSKVKNMSRMFFGANAFNNDINNWKLSEVEDMSGMFHDAIGFDQPLSSWKGPKVKNMSRIFSGATSFNKNINDWNVASVENMSDLFQDATDFDQPLDSWDVSKVNNMSGMFSNALVFNRDLSSWNVANVTDMSNMFEGANSFDQPIGSWNVAGLNNASNMFLGDFLSKENYDNLLCGWLSNTENIHSNITLNVGESKYCMCDSARTKLVTDYGWVIEDGGQESSCITGVTDLAPLQAKIAPNPTNGILNIKFAKKEKAIIVLMSIMGQEVQTKVAYNDVVLDLDALPEGVYYLSIKMLDKYLIEKIILQR